MVRKPASRIPDGASRAMSGRTADNPIDWIAEDQLRQRAICIGIDGMFGTDPPDQDHLRHLRDYLRTGFDLHVADQEHSLFPLMRLRCLPEDEIEATLDRLSADHADVNARRADLIAVLDRALAAGGALSQEDQAMFATFAASQRRHLIVENAIVLPLARVRLTEADLDDLRAGLRASRARPDAGEEPGEGPGDAG